MKQTSQIVIALLFAGIDAASLVGKLVSDLTNAHIESIGAPEPAEEPKCSEITQNDSEDDLEL